MTHEYLRVLELNVTIPFDSEFQRSLRRVYFVRMTAGWRRLYNSHVSRVRLKEKKAGRGKHARSDAWVSLQLNRAKKHRAES